MSTKSKRSRIGWGSGRLRVLGLVIGAMLGAEARGQEADTVYELSPFEVSTEGDMGYLAANSVSGTRLSAAIRDIPITVDVLTTEFLADTGALDFKSALDYTAGVFTEQFQSSSSVGVNSVDSRDRSPSASAGVGGNNNAIVIRGFNTPFQLRDGFRIGGFIPSAGVNLGGITDTVNTERIEIVRGPQSLLYGLSVLSGIANIIPKRPLAEFKGSVRVTFGTDEFVRGEIDLTGPTLAKGLNYRVFASAQDGGSWMTDQGTERQYVGVQFEQRFGEVFKVFFETQYARQRNYGTGGYGFRDAYSDEFTTNRDFRNDYGEYVDWVRDTNYGDQSRDFRLLGPDTYYHKDEWSQLIDTELKPFKDHNLILKTGVMFGQQSIEERLLRGGVVTNRNAGVLIREGVRDGKIDPGIVEVFPQPEIGAPAYPIMSTTAGPATEFLSTDDLRMLYYFWEKRPTEGENLQVRTELSYNVETPFLFGSVARHTFLLGRNDIEDVVDYASGVPSFARIDWRRPLASEQPLQYRSILDMTPFRYNGEPYPEPGMDYNQIKVWYAGHYLNYFGSYFSDRLNIVAGVRHDRYNVSTAIYDRVSWAIPPEDFGLGVDLRNPDFDAYGNPNQLLGFDEARSQFHQFNPAQTETSFSFGVNYRLNDELSIYYQRGEGVSPNTGQRDGLYQPIPAESTTSEEIGLKFELLDRKISGSVAFWKIERENVTWDYLYAPAPRNWLNGEEYLIEPDLRNRPERAFDPDARRAYWVHDRYFRDDAGSLKTDDLGNSIVLESGFLRDEDGRIVRGPDNLPVMLETHPGVLDYEKNANTGEAYVLVNYETLDGTGLRSIMEAAFFDAFEFPDNFNLGNIPDEPILWERLDFDGANNAGSTLSYNNFATFADESRGVDFNVVITPSQSLQLIFNYSYVERETTMPFQFVPVVHPDTGESLGTEYDIWVYFLGRENFDDPKDPTTLNAGLNGISLYFAPQHNASFWGKYTFVEGPLTNFGIGLGLIYTGSAQTSVPLGGRALEMNPYPTPRTPDRIRTDLALMYRFESKRYQWDFRLNITNLMDERFAERVVTYTSETGEPVQRRSQVQYTPIGVRLSAGISF